MSSFHFLLKSPLLGACLLGFFSGSIIIDTSSTGSSLEVYGTDGDTSVLIEEDSSTVDNSRTLLTMKNNGHVRIKLDNTDEGGVWSLVNRGTDILISRNGSGVEELTLDETTGNLTVAGTVTQNSDRNAKENFEPVDPAEVLDKIAQMDITTWNFKAESDEIRHMGPVAQDFARFFGLGEHENKISLVDVDGVTLAAIKGLNERLERKEAELREKTREIAALKRQNEEIGNRVLALERHMRSQQQDP